MNKALDRALVVCAAPSPTRGSFYRDIIATAGFVVAADAGALLCMQHGRPPDVLVGDLDSLPDEELRRLDRLGVCSVTAPVDKDETDLDLALAAVRESGFGHATVTAAWSDRLDHTLAATGSVAHADLVVDIADPGMAGWLLDADDRNRVLLRQRGSSVSLLALSQTAVVSCNGMRYPLIQEVLHLLSSRGVSNVITDDTAEIAVHVGRLLVLSCAVADAPVARLVEAPG